jgi:NADP-dependent 3-hydroxy acid dehydrogenase YdfG
LVNNAGAVVHVPIADASEEQFDTMIDMHLR